MLLATVVAEPATAEPTVVAVVSVEERAIATTEVHGVAPHGKKQKKRKRAESRDEDTDPDWNLGRLLRLTQRPAASA